MIEVDVGDQRNRAVAADGRQGVGGLPVGDGAAHDLAAGLGQGQDLGEGGGRVAGVGIGHRLHRHRRAAADGDGADMNLPGGSRHAASGDKRP